MYAEVKIYLSPKIWIKWHRNGTCWAICIRIDLAATNDKALLNIKLHEIIFISFCSVVDTRFLSHADPQRDRLLPKMMRCKLRTSDKSIKNQNSKILTILSSCVYRKRRNSRAFTFKFNVIFVQDKKKVPEILFLIRTSSKN